MYLKNITNTTSCRVIHNCQYAQGQMYYGIYYATTHVNIVVNLTKFLQNKSNVPGRRRIQAMFEWTAGNIKCLRITTVVTHRWRNTSFHSCLSFINGSRHVWYTSAQVTVSLSMRSQWYDGIPRWRRIKSLFIGRSCHVVDIDQ